MVCLMLSFSRCLSYSLRGAPRTRSALLGLSRLHSAVGAKEAAVSSEDSYYVSTPIYYVNGKPHLGHAYTTAVSDIIGRFQRQQGKKVFFLTGTDEHGQKVEQSAITNNKKPIEFADETSAEFRRLVDVLGCSHDDFIRTTEDRHKKAVVELWKKLEANGHIYLGSYDGWYSVRDECFYAEDELIDGKAPTGAEVEWVKEESYFFKLSEWTDKLLKFYDENPDFIAPKSRRNEVISFVSQEGGLTDLSVSRTTFSWGIPVPGNEQHVAYVWLDALTNYISALDFADNKGSSRNEDGAMTKYGQFWPADLHIVGKDILRFHCIFWPAFLMAAGLEPPKRVFAHGWWTKDGEKMSKSVGNVIDPFDLLQQYGPDYVRYFLAAEVPFGKDGDFSDDGFAARVNSDLANDVGNLAQRALTMIDKHCDGKLPVPGQLELPSGVCTDIDVTAAFTDADRELLEMSNKAAGLVASCMQQQQLKQACETIINIGKAGNRYIDVQAPWTLRKTDVARMHTVLYVLVESLRRLAILLDPVMPTSCEALLRQLGASDPGMRSLASFASYLPPGTAIGKIEPVFPRIEREGDDDGSGKKDKTVAPKRAKLQKMSKKEKAAAEEASLLEAARASHGTLDIAALAEAIVVTGDEIRALKGQGADKEQVGERVGTLKGLKCLYAEMSGGQPHT